MPALTKYEVLEELGHGGMATVYRAHDRRLGRDVAIKVLHPHLRDSREIAHRFSAEARAVAKLRHPNIVEVFDVSSEDDQEQFLVVELIRGDTLRKLLQQHGALPPEIGAAIALEILGALTHAHASGVIHRDVKPENVLLEHRVPVEALESRAEPSLPPGGPNSSRKSGDLRRGERVSVKLTDFGIAKLLDAQGVTSTGQVLGSPAHMAPEQIEGGEVDGRADVFGIGVLLYECVVGHLPFEGNNPAQVLRRVLDGIYPPAERERPTVGRVWSQILDRALARNASDRWSDAGALCDAIATELGRLGIDAPRAELEAWMDDPVAWTSAHDKRVIGRLCELGGAARKRGEAVAAAADYNRALAYAPNDPQLLRIVGSMHRAEARRRLLRRVAPLVLGAIVLGSGAYVVTRAFKSASAPVAGTTLSAPPAISAGMGEESTSPSGSVAPAARPVDSGAREPANAASAATASSAPSSTPSPPSNGAVAAPGGQAAGTGQNGKPSVRRTVTLASLRPPFGVHLAIDGQPAAQPSQGTTFTLDDKPHVLTFTCEKDMCEPRTVQIAPGEGDESLSVELRIHPAKIVVEGDPSHSYGIEEFPYVTLGSGVATEVPMRAGQQMVTVFDRSEPTARHKALLRAGQQEVVTFR